MNGGDQMPQMMSELLQKYTAEIVRIYGSSLKEIILYGSYARGDNREDSDIDIMILVDLDDTEIKSKGDALSDVTFDYNFDFDLQIMPIVKNQQHFNKWLNAYPFYNNVRREGVDLYVA